MLFTDPNVDQLKRIAVQGWGGVFTERIGIIIYFKKKSEFNDKQPPSLKSFDWMVYIHSMIMASNYFVTSGILGNLYNASSRP